MKLLWITHRRQSEMSSTSRRGVSQALEARGWTVEFMSPDGDHTVERSKQLGRGHRSFTRNVSNKLSQMDLQLFTIAIVEWTGVEGACQALSDANLPWVIMDRSPPVSTGFVGWFQRRQYNKAWGIARSISVGRCIKSSFMAESQPWNKASAIVTAGVDSDAFECATMNEKPVVVCHGSLDRTRELHRLVKMDVNLLLFGEGNDKERLSKITNVEPAGNVASKLAGADIGVLHLPNRDVWKHASPLKVAEYAAAGLVVVASNISGLDEFKNAEWLTLIPLGDDESCNTALQALCNLPVEERRRLGALARDDAENKMNWNCCTESLHEMLLEVKR